MGLIELRGRRLRMGGCGDEQGKQGRGRDPGGSR